MSFEHHLERVIDELRALSLNGTLKNTNSEEHREAHLCVQGAEAESVAHVYLHNRAHGMLGQTRW